jgi:hypothetical protein
VGRLSEEDPNSDVELPGIWQLPIRDIDRPNNSQVLNRLRMMEQQYHLLDAFSHPHSDKK